MQKISLNTKWIKFVGVWAAIFLVRFIPFRAPNVEPMLASLMPFSKRFGAVSVFVFAFLGIFLYDLLTSGIGVWTWITAFAYGALAIGSYFFFKNRTASVKNFVGFGIVGTVLYDAATGLTIGPLFFHQTFMAALIGQIPFTLLHLAGTITFSVFLSPVLYYWVMRSEVLEINLSFKLAPR
jgi:uncharacterized membrane protein